MTRTTNHETPAASRPADTRPARRWPLGLLVALCAFLPVTARALDGSLTTPQPWRTEPAPDELKNITVDEHLGATVPLDAAFTDDANQAVTLGTYLNGARPVIVQLGYYGCPMLCDYISRGLATSLKDLDVSVGADFDVVFISIDPNENWALAQTKKRAYLQDYNRGGAAGGLHLLTGSQQQITRVAKALGFNYKWVPSAGQFSHPAALVVCAPNGKISRYVYGVKFEPALIKTALAEAKAGVVRESVDKFVLSCFQFDGKQGRHAAFAMSLMRLGGAVTALALVGGLVVVLRREHRRRGDGDKGNGFPMGPASSTTTGPQT